jgi:hypothetical protein
MAMKEHSNNGREVFYVVRAEVLKPEPFSSCSQRTAGVQPLRAVVFRS